MKVFSACWWMSVVLALSVAANVGADDGLPEHPLFRQFGTAQGLPSATVHKLAQDRDGNLWIATLDGLARYDGVSFTVWRHDPDDPDSLPSNDIEFVMVDSDDRVWIAPQNAGIARYEPLTDGFTRWQHDPDDPGSLPGNRIWALADDGEGGLWIGGYLTGLVRMERDGTMRSYRREMIGGASGCNDIILSLVRSADGGLWIGTNAGLCRWHADTGFARVDIDDANPNQRVMGIHAGGALPWLAATAGLRAPRGMGAPAIPAMLAGAHGMSIEVEPDGWIWLGTRNGIHRWQPSTGATAVHMARPGQAMSLPSPSIADILRDHEGSMWFATQGGLAQLVPHWRAIRVYLSESGQPDGLPAGRPRVVSVGHDGRLWVTSDTSRGVSQLDPATGTVRRWFVAGDGHSEPDADTRAIISDRHGRLWLGHRAAVSRYTPGRGDYRRFDRDRNGQALPQTVVRQLAELPDGRILAAFGGGGIAWIDDDAGTLDFDPLGEHADLPCAEASDIHAHASGSVWIACERGLLRARPGERRFHPVEGAPRQPVHGLAFADDGSLWLHALGLLGRYEIVGETLASRLSVGSRDGWPLVDAGGVAIDPQGVVWVNSRRGLHAYEPRTGHVATYDEAHGLPSAEFIDAPPVWLAPGRLATGTSTGVVLIDTVRVRASLPVATLRWHQASVSRAGQRMALPTGTQTPWTLAHDDRDLRIAVRLGSLLKPDAHRYRFRLNDDPWHEQAGQPERLVDSLPSGRHQLEVEALGSDGQPSGNRLLQTIQVGLPPWRQPWALALYGLAIIAAVLAGQRAYRRRLERRHALALANERRRWAEQSSAAKTRFLASVGHEIRTPMAGLLGMNELLLGTPLSTRQHHFATSIQRAGRHMLDLVNDLLDLSRIESGQLTLDATRLDLVTCLDEVIGEIAANAEAKGLVLSQRIEPGTPLRVHADGKRLHQILLNLLNNAIKFTGEGHVRLLASRVEERHRFQVIDNGPGISDELRNRLFQRYSQDEAGRRSGGSGLGLAIARELVELMGGDIGVEAAPGGGSLFWFEITLAHEADPLAAEAAAHRLAVRVIDADAQRRDDLDASLRALGIAVSETGDTAAIAVVAADSADAAHQLLADAGRHFDRVVLSLPLACAVSTLPPAITVLPGPWQLGPLTRALRAQASQAPAEHHGAPAMHKDGPSLAGMRLLLVEDDVILGEVMAHQLQQRGAAVELVTDGLAALVATGTTCYHGIILDLDLPELDGLRVLAMLRRTLTPMPPVVIATARQQPDDEALCLAAGARAFFRKPVDADQVALALLDARQSA